jgi:Mrp family chromosome partitioning ATPase
MMAVETSRKEYKTGILDADITGPSIPKIFGVKEDIEGDESGMFPVKTTTGIRVISTNLLLKNDTDPVVWRGPVIAGTVKQFWTDVIWKDVDYMFVDMPPGTGDVPLTVFQSIPLDGIIVVTSPQELVSMIVGKAVKMAELMNVPILGLVENMSYFKCPDCGREHKIFGESHIEDIAEEYGTRVLAKVPLDDSLAKSVDTGTVELFVGDWFNSAADIIEDELKV